MRKDNGSFTPSVCVQVEARSHQRCCSLEYTLAFGTNAGCGLGPFKVRADWKENELRPSSTFSVSLQMALQGTCMLVRGLHFDIRSTASRRDVDMDLSSSNRASAAQKLMKDGDDITIYTTSAEGLLSRELELLLPSKTIWVWCRTGLARTHRQLRCSPWEAVQPLLTWN